MEEKSRAETETLQAALTRVQEAADRGEEVGGSEDESDGPSGVEDKAEDASYPAPKISRRRVVTSRPNTAEVVIVRPVAKGKGPAGRVAPEEVSAGPVSAKLGLIKLAPLLPRAVREVRFSGGTLRALARPGIHMYAVPKPQGQVQLGCGAHQAKVGGRVWRFGSEATKAGCGA